MRTIDFRARRRAGVIPNVLTQCMPVVFSLIVLGTLLPNEGSAQSLVGRPSVGIAAGFSRGPLGDNGFHGLVRLESPTRWSGLRLRAEGLYAQWGGIDVNDVQSATASAVVVLRPQARVAPYLIAGGGAYDLGSVVKGGWTAGAGLRLRGSWPVTIESRLHTFTSGAYYRPPGVQFDAGRRTIYMPVSIGVQF